MIDLGVFDLETTGVDVHGDLIVTAYFGLLGADGTIIRDQEWIVDPGIEIPEGAASVHGYTNERLDADPRTRRDLGAVVREIASLIWAACGPHNAIPLPLAGHNVSFDLTMLNEHLIREGAAPLPFGPATTPFGHAGILVLDSIVLDKHYSQYVKGAGQRKLTPTAARYGVHLTEEQAHDASFDALASGRICQAILAKRVPRLFEDLYGTLTQLHLNQVGWRAQQQVDLQKWLRKGTDPNAVCETGWPSYERTAA